ncbi:MAG: hypothetical protein DRG24_09375 [Epsilonproteobacteria bacterium]|nr:MAG: hypothetical protein DRG24_09375 [Campylobacterota bacterium]
MEKMTMHQELDMLREEVETRKTQKAVREKDEAAEVKKVQEAEKKKSAEAEKKAEEIMASLDEGKTDAKEALNQLVDTIKNDYENLSPTSAIVLFALGAVFGHALSSK